MLLGIDLERSGKIATGANLPCVLIARQYLPLSVKFAGTR
jgi:hypothetical protein